jgi:hypothetical protein
MQTVRCGRDARFAWSGEIKHCCQPRAPLPGKQRTSSIIVIALLFFFALLALRGSDPRTPVREPEPPLLDAHRDVREAGGEADSDAPSAEVRCGGRGKAAVCAAQDVAEVMGARIYALVFCQGLKMRERGKGRRGWSWVEFKVFWSRNESEKGRGDPRGYRSSTECPLEFFFFFFFFFTVQYSYYF